MSEAPKRRWLRFSLRRVLFWDVPYVALMALILSPFFRRPPPRPANVFDMAELAEAMAFGLAIEFALFLTLIWLLVPIAIWSAARILGRWKRRPPATRS